MKLIIAEKKKVAAQIAPLVGATNEQDGYFEGGGYQVSWAIGHLVELQMPEDYNAKWKKWDATDLPIVPREFKLRVNDASYISKQYDVVASLLRSCAEVINAADAGREGEHIFRLIYELSGSTARIKRLWASSLTDEALNDALADLKNGSEYDNLAAAAMCRSKADWLVGLNATRGFTTVYHTRKPLSVGRVQTPVLKLIVDRRRAIDNFKSTPYWDGIAIYRDTTFKAKIDRFEAKEVAEKWLARFNSDIIEVKNVEAKERREQSPLLFDLTELQREMNKRHGWKASKTLEELQGLYESGYVTYPRTDSRYLSKDLVDDVIKAVSNHVSDVAQLEALDIETSHKAFNDAKVTDHHAVIPTAKKADLDGQKQDLYAVIVNRTIAAFSAECVKEITTVSAAVESVDFEAKGTVIKSLGWRAVETAATKAKEETVMPSFEIGETGKCSVDLKKGNTKPLPEFNDASLLTAMETAGKALDEDTEIKEAMKEKGLGTPATRSGIIETLEKREFIERKKKSIVCTDTGSSLIDVIGDSTVASVKLTAEWEHKLTLIEKGEYAPEEFIENVTAYMTALVAEIKEPNAKAKAALQKATNSEGLGECPKCKKQVADKGKIYTCPDRSCDFVIFKTMAKKELSPTVVSMLLDKKKSGLLKGFTSKAGKKFDAYVILQDDFKTGFEFPPYKKK